MIVPDNCIELRCYWTWMNEEGIAVTKVKPKAEVVLEDAMENSKAVNSFPSNRYSLLIDTKEIKSITKEARDFFSMKGRDSKVIAFAILIKSPLSTIIANFFMGLNKPRVPVRLFYDEKKALDWCKTHI